jgi:nitrile hydratase
MENMPPLDYLRSSYYERFYVSLTERLVASGLVTRSELDSGIPQPGGEKSNIALAPSAAVAAMMKNPPTRRELPVPPRFRVGERVRARNIQPVTHTRLPRYVRGKPGTVLRDHGVFVFSDTSVYGQGEKPQHIYSVRFAARDVWGEQAPPHDSVCLDLFDDYLEAI